MNVAYYNELGIKTSISKESREVVSKKGNFSIIYRIGNISFKEYLKKTPQRYRLPLSLFRVLRTIQNPHFLELYSLYTECFPLKHMIVHTKKMFLRQLLIQKNTM